jgi:type VI secretion system protein
LPPGERSNGVRPAGSSTAMSDVPSFHPRQALVRLGVLLLAVCLVASCGVKRKVSRLFAGDVKMQVTVSPRLNNNTPVPVEIVYLYDQGLLESVLQKSAQDWFANREQIIKDNSPRKKLESWYWEWVPGQKFEEPFDLSYRIGARGAVIFAGYASAGNHRQAIDPQLNITLNLGPESFTVEQSR